MMKPISGCNQKNNNNGINHRAWKIAEASDGNLVESQGVFLGVQRRTNFGFPHLMGFNSKG